MSNLDSGRRVLIAAHRGTAGGNIPCNTLASYELALYDGADVIELDVAKSRDGALFCFHPGMEHVMYADPTPIAKLTAAEATRRHLRNQDLEETVYTAPYLDEAFENLKNRCLIAVDKFWMAMPEISDCIRRHGLQEQVLCKIPDRPGHYEAAAALAPELPVLPVIHTEDRSTAAPYTQGVRIAGVEALFDREDAPVASDEYIEALHRQGKLIWVNPIVYNKTAVLTAGHTDDVAVAGDRDSGWGWLIDKGFDILQTDFTAQLRRYIKERP